MVFVWCPIKFEKLKAAFSNASAKTGLQNLVRANFDVEDAPFSESPIEVDKGKIKKKKLLNRIDVSFHLERQENYPYLKRIVTGDEK
ncbi:hypothetical protein CEXT_92461 [Caerostris extrusa]|uniref:Uncharacterized protein n=1 Tax=Caerostris extrusa TaxID=172846 RepID=A0AAV4RIG6_CAEEX|nr:hypothetical protein CEXT_92461 [Caerostris extrusa]